MCTCKATGSEVGFCDGTHHTEPVLLKYSRQLLKANSELKEDLASLKRNLAIASMLSVGFVGSLIFLLGRK